MLILLRTAAALVLIAGFYGAHLGLAGYLLYQAYLAALAGGEPAQILLLFFPACASFLLWSVFPRSQLFEPPGPLLERARHPRLFAEIDAIARAAGEAPPAEVYLLPDVNAFVAEWGGLFGFRRRRILGLGLALLRVLGVDELRGVLAHEFGHYHGGETRLGPWLYRAREAIGRTIAAMARLSVLLHFPFLWFGKLFLLATRAVSRRQELAADAFAARLTGARGVASGLRKTHGANTVFARYLAEFVAPVLESGYRPPYAEGFGRFLSEGEIARAVEEDVREQLQGKRRTVYDTHPTLPDRLAALAALPESGATALPPGGDAPALELLEGVADVEAQMFERLFADRDHAALKPIGWAEAAVAVWLPSWRKHVRRHGSPLKGRTAAELGGLAADAARLGHLMTNDLGARAAVATLAEYTLGAALTLALVDAGWAMETGPDCPVRISRAGETVEPFALVRGVRAEPGAAAAWSERCARLGLGGLDLGGGAARQEG
ncbi:MAG: M48 family metalloprotease [Planctomycetes bacterium]|nr:M48 family metalloprotease [Planctomycetota bacterium]